MFEGEERRRVEEKRKGRERGRTRVDCISRL